MKRQKIVVFTGAGISAESGLQTFRGTDGLWEGHRIEDVATPEAWAKDPKTVQRFYNIRRATCRNASPNTGHLALVELEKYADVQIITQNIDDLHERAGSKSVLHLHGEIMKSQSSKNPELVYPIEGDEIKIDEKCEIGSPLRPHVVWFGEAVPNMSIASRIVKSADVLLIVGTSLQVYPAANLLHDVSPLCKIVLIDPNSNSLPISGNIEQITGKAATELPKWIKRYAE
ncbi:SIR2 family NAD-dependent protein deacylase [Sphingobacterium bovistauri]|uniref:NAD-dependent protein deacylase n=1 Tax=Sphingobacterium bovistauri TaxID=2781959 RepID=A0ABS7Z897_9SPHI|nr:Sir2 family NAD-dependent protein deacetylase [Sphingobacterium bovistauri]MCA5006411.1 NAD-dependent deacylase [Sphingobacterium bovistauri]